MKPDYRKHYIVYDGLEAALIAAPKAPAVRGALALTPDPKPTQELQAILDLLHKLDQQTLSEEEFTTWYQRGLERRKKAKQKFLKDFGKIAWQDQIHIGDKRWYVADLPGHHGLVRAKGSACDWGWTDDRKKAIPLTPYWQRRFAKYARDCGNGRAFGFQEVD